MNHEGYRDPTADKAVGKVTKDEKRKKQNSMVNHPNHYNREGGIECWDEMELVFGREALELFCKMNAWKYRYRAGDKGTYSQDIKKSDSYMKKLKEMLEDDKNGTH